MLPAGRGRGTRLQARPFHRTIRSSGCVVPVEPTAQAFRAEEAATPKSWPRIAEAAEPAGPVRATAVAAVTGTAAKAAAASSGIVRTVTERATSWDLRTGCRLPPGRAAGP